MYKNNINLRSLAKNNTSKVLFYSQSIKTSDNYRHLTMDLKAIFQQRQQKILPQQKLTLATRTQTHLLSYGMEFIGYPLGIQLWLSFKCHLPHTNDLWWKTIDLEKNCIPLPLFASRMAHCCLTQFETFMESSERIHVYLICNKGNKKNANILWFVQWIQYFFPVLFPSTPWSVFLPVYRIFIGFFFRPCLERSQSVSHLHPYA